MNISDNVRKCCKELDLLPYLHKTLDLICEVWPNHEKIEMSAIPDMDDEMGGVNTIYLEIYGKKGNRPYRDIVNDFNDRFFKELPEALPWIAYRYIVTRLLFHFFFQNHQDLFSCGFPEIKNFSGLVYGDLKALVVSIVPYFSVPI